jgi:hypothetical protein
MSSALRTSLTHVRALCSLCVPIYYEGNSISKLQIQVATYVFELSAGNCHRYIAALSSFSVTHNDQYRMTVQTYQLLQDGGAPEYMFHDRTAWRCAFFCGQKIWMQQRISIRQQCETRYKSNVVKLIKVMTSSRAGFLRYLYI